jgi:hypothetical protein
MPSKKQELTAAQFRLAKQAGLTSAKTAAKAKIAPADLRTLRAMTPSKKASTRTVFVKLTPAQIRGIRRDGLDTVLPHVKGGVFVRVPKDAKRVKVSVAKENVETAWVSKRGTKYRRVDTPMKPKDWADVDSRKFASSGKKPKERVKKITVAVAGYDSTKRYRPSAFAQYITRNFGPSVRSARKRVKNHFSVRRIYVSHTGKKAKPTKRRNRRV